MVSPGDGVQTRVGAGLLAFMVVFGVAAGAAAQTQAAVLQFRGGRDADSVRTVVAQRLNTIVTVIPYGDVEDAARRKGVEPNTAEGIERVSRELLLDFVFEGEVRGRGDAATLTLISRDSKGEELARTEMSGPLTGKKDKPRVEALTDALYETTRKVLSGEAQAEADQISARQKKVTAGDLGDLTVKGRLEEVGDPHVRGPYDHPMLTFYFGFGGRNRDATVNLKSDLRRVYSAALFPELALSFTARPYGRKNNALRGIYAAGEMALSVGLGSQDDLKREFDSSTFRFNLDVGYLARFSIVEVGGTLGFGYDNFSIGENLVIPNSTYTYLRPAVLARVDIIPSWLYAGAEAALRIGLGSGEVVDVFAERGTNFGFDAGILGGGAVPDLGLAYALRLQYIQHSISFSGTAPNASETADDMSDGSFRIMAFVGYQIWSGFQ
ncbi:MAG: hypothetical protein R3A78_13180 [Polyangiales bacterium]|nr:hypothetical protein [Myxococcales bacterium]